jgi:hypothetical protein
METPTTMMKSRWIGLCVCLVLVACAPRATQTGSKRNNLRELITHEEIEESTQRNLDLYSVIQSLRPQMLAPPPGIRRASNDVELAVYVNKIKQNGVVALRSISALSVSEVRYLNPTQSQNQLGQSASNGAIMVTLRTPD